MSAAIIQTPIVSSSYDIAIRKAYCDAGLQKEPLSYLEEWTHFARSFNPIYEQFYHEKRVEAFAQAGKQLPPYVGSWLREGVLFLQRFVSSPTTIGSLFPSSSFLVDAMTRKVTSGVTAKTPARRYLDVGAGTGSFTAGIIEKMRPQDHLDVVEFDPNLASLLQRRFGHLPNVHIHCVSIFDFSPSRCYDVVVTGLPLNNFPAEDVKRALQKYGALTRPGGSFCYFEYMALPAIAQVFRRLFGFGASADNFSEVEQVKADLCQKAKPEVDSVFWNLTPARAIHCSV